MATFGFSVGDFVTGIQHQVSSREGVVRLKDTIATGIPPGARWTKIDRRLVNPEALEEAKERFEERLDCVIVLRVLTREEIQKLADRTSEMRGERDVEERQDRKVTKRRERQRTGHEPDEYTDSSEEERAERKSKMLETLESPTDEAEPEPEYGDEDRVSSTKLQEPRSANHERLHDIDANDNDMIVADRDKATSRDVHHQRTDHVGGRRRFGIEEDRRSLVHENVDSENAYSYTDPATMYATTEPKWRAGGLRRSKSSEMRQSSPLDVPGEPSYALHVRPTHALHVTPYPLRISVNDLGPPPSTKRSEALDRASSALKWLPDTYGVRPEISLSTNAYCQGDSDDEPSQSTPLGESALAEFRVFLGPTSDDESHPSTSASPLPDQTDLSEDPGNAVLFAHLDPDRQDLIQDRLATRRSPEPTSPSQTSMDPGARVFFQPNERFRSGDDDDEIETCRTPTSVSSEPNTAGGMSGWSSTNAISRIDGITTSAGTAPTTVEGNSPANKSGLPLSGEAQHAHDDLPSILSDNRDIGATVSRHDRKTFAIRFACELIDSLDLKELSDGTFTSLPDIILDFSRLLDHRAHHKVEHQASTFVRHHRENISRYARECLQFELRKSRLNSGVYDFVSWIAGVSGDGDQPADRPSDLLDLPDLDFERIRDEDLPADANQARQFLVESEEFQWLLNRIRRTCRATETGPECRALRQQLIDIQDLVVPCFAVHIDWSPVKFIETQYRGEPGGTISTTIAYNGTGDLIEAVGCKEYVHRMWPSFGGMVLDCVERAVRDGSKDEYADAQASSRDAKVTLRLTLMSSGLFATIEGNSVAQIEIMETLSWLGAACRVSPDPEQAMYCTPLLSQLYGGDWGLDFSTTSLDDLFKEEAKNGESVLEAVDSTMCWSQLVRNPVIVKGYPIARRHHDEKGLEIEAGLLTTLADSTRAVIFDGALMLTGLCSTLVAVSKANESILWHYLLGDNNNPVCYNDARKYCKQAAPISFGSLSSMRHFVGWTDFARVLTGTADANYNVDFAGKPIRAGCALRDVTVGFSKIMSMSTKLTPGLKDTRLTYSKPERYKWQVEHAEKMRVVFYDVRDKRAFLIDGADAILHLSRAYLSSPHAPPFDHNYSAQLVEEFVHRRSSKQKYQDARQILCKSRNRKIAICRVDDSSDDGSSVDGAAGSTADPDEMRFEHLVVHFYEILREMQAHQFKIRKSEQWSVPIKNPFVARLEGFGFADMMALPTSLEPRYAQLNVSGPSWLEVTDKAGAINILGTGFGDLFSSSSSDCNKCTIIPPGYDFLVSSTKILISIAAFRMGIGERHLELAEGVFWNWPERSCRSSKCDCANTPSHGVRCDVMVTELQAYGVQPPQGKAYPQNSEDLPPHAAVIFGNPGHLKRTRKTMSGAATAMDCEPCILHRRRYVERALSPHQALRDYSRSSGSGSASVESTQGSTKRESNASTSMSSRTSGSQRISSNASTHNKPEDVHEPIDRVAAFGLYEIASSIRTNGAAVVYHGEQARAGAAATTDSVMHSDHDLVTQVGRDDLFIDDPGHKEAVLKSYQPRTSDLPVASWPAAAASASTYQRRNRSPDGAQVDLSPSQSCGEHERWNVRTLRDDRRSNNSARESVARENSPASESVTYDGPAPLKMSVSPYPLQRSPGPTSEHSPLPASHQHLGRQLILSDNAPPQDSERTDHSSPESLADRTSLSSPRLRRKAGSVMRTSGVDRETGPGSVVGRVQR
ncbi:hypothetical protein LTR56_019525 [Elasticomyces elasticus]|nr:hypothetical protein LTR56_019525 [Elasticomyces elasticus]KAK3653736.1 hypothetical protein LTR22_011114 [Elasticomyces elasticus]KAK4924156.1 hypothetical protein LTR49_008676 [Elasticomyces elasticus]KAK5758504.1 hypothetical protein LTS12_011367 [Elasticomyces elasticus]